MIIKAILCYMTLFCIIDISLETCSSPRTRNAYGYFAALECENLTSSLNIPMAATGRYGYQVTVLKIRNSNFTNLQANSLQSQYITEIIISDTALTTIEPSGFNNVPELEELRLANNNISTITKGVFNHLTNMRTLDLSNNSIEYIESHSLLGTKIKSLLLDHNEIEDISAVIENCATYTTLTLNFNAIKTIKSLNNCTQLQMLSISDNTVGRLSGKLFPNSLKALNLSSNQIESVEIDTFAELAKLHTLDLSNNKLYKVSDGSIPLGLFQPLAGLKNLNLSHNGLSELLPGTFTKLSLLNFLDLGYNNLTHISVGLLSHLPLTFLSIRENHITELDNNLLNHKITINIDIDGNPWNCDYLFQKIYHIINLRPLNSVVNGNHTNMPNINGIKCNHNSVVRKNNMNHTLENSRYNEILQILFDNLDTAQQDTNDLLADVKDLLHNITVSRQQFSNTTDYKSPAFFNMTKAIIEDIKQLQEQIQKNSQRDDLAVQRGRSFMGSNVQENITGTDRLSGYQPNSDLSQIRVLLLLILLAVIVFIVLIVAVFVFMIYRSKNNAQIRIPQDSLLNTYSM